VTIVRQHIRREHSEGPTVIRTVTTIVIGAGHAGLAMSRCLAERAIDHVVLERGEVANTWRNERWDSLRLLTPNWQSRLPGFSYSGGDPDSYRTVPELIRFIEDYAKALAAPVETNTRVTSVSSDGTGYLVRTDRGDWTCRSVVLASGACNLPDVPACAGEVPRSIDCLTAQLYRNPGQLADGGVLVVGASASGTQIAQEIRKTGRAVYLSVGEHIRAPRRYRGKDIQWWLDAAGVQNERYDAVDDIARARKVPSLQLAGTVDRSTLDLNALSDLGVTLVGRLGGIAHGKAQFAGSLRNMCTLSDLKMERLLETFDNWARENGIDRAVEPPHRLPPTRVADQPPLGLNLAGNIKTIIWATGYRPDYSWLELPVLDRKGMIRHDGGIAALPGLYLMVLHFMRRRKSSLIDGAGDDARDLSDHLAAYLGAQTSKPERAGERLRSRSEVA
jgi:putative flavoprotein involved in K+ transport